MRYNNGIAGNFTNITAELFPTRIRNYMLCDVTSSGEDSKGELYIPSLGGAIFKIRNARN